jgi:hypothetical protein
MAGAKADHQQAQHLRAPNRTISTAIDSSMNSHIVGRSTIT